MKRIAVILTAFLMAAVPASSVVGNNASGDMTIMGQSSSTGTTAAGPEGARYRSTVSMIKRSQADTDDAVKNVSFEASEMGKKADFSGNIVAPDPCHVIESNVQKNGKSYVLGIETVKEDSDEEQICIQAVTGIRYKGSFEAEAPYTLEIRHNGEEVKKVQTASKEDGENGFMKLLWNLLGITG